MTNLLHVFYVQRYDTLGFPQAFALLGFVVSAVLISATASEVVGLLHMLGVVWSLSNTVLGLTLLAWGNSIGGASLWIQL